MFRVFIVVPFVLIAIAALYWSQQQSGPERVSGVIEADDVRVGSLVGGRIAEVRAREGQRVARGDTLIVLEPHDWNERLAQAEATLAAARARLDELHAGTRREEIDQARARRDRVQAVLARLIAGPRPLEIQTLEEKLAQADATLKKAEFDHQRISELMSQGNAAKEEMERVTRDLTAARAAAAVARDELALAREGTRAEEIAESRAELAQAEAALTMLETGPRPEEIREAEAQTAAAQAAVSVIRRQLAETSIAAPLDGFIEAVDLRPGDLIGPSAPVLTMIDASSLYVRAYIPENRLDITVGTKLSLGVDALPARRFAGTITFVSRDAEFTPSNVQTPEERVKQVFRVKIGIDEGRDVLRPGMAVDVYLPPPK
ncbi:MAG: HlyD family efflux transporter periplasmic adaptor subunit [Phycisphaerae bacterium]